MRGYYTQLTRRGKIVSAVVALAAIGWIMPDTPEVEPGSGPWRYCVTPDDPDRAKAGALDCYLNGDVPAGKRVVWSGYESNVPHMKPETTKANPS